MHILLGALTSSTRTPLSLLVYKCLVFEDPQSSICPGSLFKPGKEHLSQPTDGEARGQGDMTWGQRERPVTPLSSLACPLLSQEWSRVGPGLCPSHQADGQTTD